MANMQKLLNVFSSNKMSVAVILIIVILLSVPFPAFHSSILGKSVLIAAIIILSYCHKVLGILAVIVLILLYQSTENRFYWNNPYPFSNLEGFTGTGTIKDASGNVVKTVQLDSSGGTISSPVIHKDIQFDISGNIDIAKKIQTMISGGGGSGSGSGDSSGQEGFDLLGTEDTLRKGKQSNTISTKKDENNLESMLLPFENNSKYIESFLVL